jgi:hypothetical protein
MAKEAREISQWQNRQKKSIGLEQLSFVPKNFLFVW